MSKKWKMGQQDLVDLATEFGLVRGTAEFMSLPPRAQGVVLCEAARIADGIDFTGCFERVA